MSRCWNYLFGFSIKDNVMWHENMYNCNALIDLLVISVNTFYYWSKMDFAAICLKVRFFFYMYMSIFVCIDVIRCINFKGPNFKLVCWKSLWMFFIENIKGSNIDKVGANFANYVVYIFHIKRIQCYLLKK